MDKYVRFDGSRVLVALSQWCAILSIAALAACGSGNVVSDKSGGSGDTQFSIGGNVTGMASGTHLVLQNNWKDNKTISANGAFTFDTSLQDGSPYAVTILTQPAGQTCYVTSGSSGTVSGANVTGVNIVCSSVSTAGCDINVTTSDSYTKLEAATPGQTVCIAPGTYNFRVWLHKQATAAQPITIKALDPAHRPVFDYTGWTNGWVNGVPPFPGSYTNSDAYRSAWLVDGAYYIMDGIIIQNANNAGNINFDNTAGIRYVNSSYLTVRNCRLYHNDMGIQGGGSNTLIEYSEFDRNGYAGSDQSHNIYILGGDVFTLRYSYSHDSVGGQNFHIRARNAVVAYNWFQNAADYEGDMMTNTTTYDAGANGTQNLLFIGNVVVQNPGNGNGFNPSKFITVYNDVGTAGLTMNLTVLWNTFMVTDPGGNTTNGILQFSKNTVANGTITMSNNIVAGYARSAVINDGGAGSLTVVGNKNYFSNGSNVGVLTNSIFGASPLFTNPSASNFTLQTGSPASGVADTSIGTQPTWRFSTPPPISNPNSTPPATDPPSISNDVSPRTSVTNLGALQD